MKKIIFSLVLSLFASISFVDAQRIAIVDVTTVLESLTEYTQTQKEIDKIAAQWQQEVAQEYDEIKSMYNKYQAEQVLLSDDARRNREDEIMNKEKEVREMQKQRFGAEGDLFRKRQELISPIQDKVFAAIENFADKNSFDIIMDKSSTAGILFTSEDYDKTEEIKRELGIR